MKLSTSLLLVANLCPYVLGEAATTSPAPNVRLHAREFISETTNALQNLDLTKRAAPSVPHGQDDTKLHVWIRTDARPTNYDDRSGAKHDGLNQLMKDTGGRHKDVVVGNSKGHYEYGLQFEDGSWQKKPNGDGAPVADYAGPYDEVPNGHETYVYKGKVKDGRRTLESIKKLASAEIKGKTYNHKSYNCETFAQDLAKALV